MEEWVRDSISPCGGFLYNGGRSLEDYATDLGFFPADIAGKYVLDLGAGGTALFEHSLIGVSFVVSLSPDYSLERHRKALPSGVEHAVAAVGQSLPFPQDVFDTVCMYHVREHITSCTLRQIIYESLRVLVPGGALRIMPILPEVDEESIGKWMRHRKAILTFEETSKQMTFYQDPSDSMSKYRVRLKRAIITKQGRKHQNKISI